MTRNINLKFFRRKLSCICFKSTAKKWKKVKKKKKEHSIFRLLWWRGCVHVPICMLYRTTKGPMIHCTTLYMYNCKIGLKKSSVLHMACKYSFRKYTFFSWWQCFVGLGALLLWVYILLIKVSIYAYTYTLAFDILMFVCSTFWH